MHTLMLDYKNTQRKSSPTETGLLLFGLLVITLAGLEFIFVSSELDALLEKKSVIERSSKPVIADTKLQTLNEQQIKSEMSHANVILAQLGLPWDILFHDIESLRGGRVALLAVEPNVEKRTVKISGEAKDFTAMLDYITLLQKKGSLERVYLQSHHIEQQIAEKPVRFVLKATWVIKP